MYALKWGLPYLSKYKAMLIFGQIINLINIALSLVNPLMAGRIVGNVIIGGQNELLFRYLGVMVGITVYRSVARYCFLMMHEHVAQKILYELRHDVYYKLHSQNFPWFDKNKVGDIMARMTGDLDALRHFVAFTIHAVPENIILYFAAIIAMAFISVPLTLLLMITTPIVIYAAVKQSREIRPAFRNIREQFSNLNSVCSENIGGNRVVKAFTQEEYETEKFDRANGSFYNANMETARIRIKYFPVMETCAALLPWILLLFGGLMVIWGYLELWQLVTISGYLWMINNPTRMFTWCINDLQNAATSLDKIFEMMRQEIFIKSPENAVKKDRLEGKIEFKDVCYKYSYEPGSNILNNISFTANPGDTIGIIGKTGAGKTTLMLLLSRFYDTRDGQLLIDGIDVKDYDLQSLRKNIAYAMQDIFLFSDTVEGNIAYGVPDAPLENILEAADIADANEFVSRMPEGYDTIVGERGVGLSGGQKQRISLARAIATDPVILILDDVTSAVDMETEHRIQNALSEKIIKSGKQRTTFIVAHRLSSVRHADLILVLENGEIKERGTHDELLAQKGHYYELHEEQKAMR